MIHAAKPALINSKESRESFEFTGLEKEWRDNVTNTLRELRDGQKTLDTKFASMETANEVQHATLAGRLDVMTASFEQALRDANKALESRDKVIKVLVAFIIFLLGVLAEAKLHVTEFMKALAG